MELGLIQQRMDDSEIVYDVCRGGSGVWGRFALWERLFTRL